MDQELWLKALHFHGEPLLQTVLGDGDLNQEPDNEKLVMCRFIKDKLGLLFMPSESESTSDFPIDDSFPLPPVPLESFRNATHQERRDIFYKSLDRGDILTLRVINDSLPEDYKLLALCKDGCDMKLDDLSLIMYLPKLPAELHLAGGMLQSNDIIRAALCSCDIDNRKLNVTLGNLGINVLEHQNVKLGKISESDLPPYVGRNVDFGSSYVEQLHNSPAFKNPNWAVEFRKNMNLKENYMYSFFFGLDGKKYHPGVYGKELKKKQDLVLSNEKVIKGNECHSNGLFAEAFLFYNTALALFPENIEALVARGTLYANTNNLKKAFNDIEHAIRIDANHTNAKAQMSILLVAAARMHMSSNLKRAEESLEAALHLDGNNTDAIYALEEVKKKIASSLSDPDKAAKMLEKKARIGSGSSESSCSRKDDPKDKHSLEAHTKLFMSSLKRSHKDKGKKHHHSHKEKDYKEREHREKDHREKEYNKEKGFKEKDQKEKGHRESKEKEPQKPSEQIITID